LLEAAVERYGRAGSSEPDVDELVALERDVRAAVRDRAVRSDRVTGFIQSLITVVLFVLVSACS
jgi:hypothetical protein